MADQTTAVATIDRAGQELDRLSSEAQALSIFDGGKFSTALAAARMMHDISTALDGPGVRDAIMPLIGSPIGIRTDRDADRSKSQYRWEDVKPAVIEATMRGVPHVGNCWNLIAGRCYVTKEGFGLLLKKIKGLRYSIVCSVPESHGEKGAVVDARIRWTLNGEAHDETVPFAIRLNAGMGADAAVGKATRKARAWLYGTVTGSETPEGDAEEVVNVTAAGSDRPAPESRIRAKREAAAEPPEAKPEAAPEAKPSPVPYKLESAYAALDSKAVPHAFLLALLRSKGTLTADQGLKDMPQAMIAYIVEHPDKIASEVIKFADAGNEAK